MSSNERPSISLDLGTVAFYAMITVVVALFLVGVRENACEQLCQGPYTYSLGIFERGGCSCITSSGSETAPAETPQESRP